METIKTAKRVYFINETSGAFDVHYRVINPMTGQTWQGIKMPKAPRTVTILSNRDTGDKMTVDGPMPENWSEYGGRAWNRASELYKTIEQARAACV